MPRIDNLCEFLKNLTTKGGAHDTAPPPPLPPPPVDYDGHIDCHVLT